VRRETPAPPGTFNEGFGVGVLFSLMVIFTVWLLLAKAAPDGKRAIQLDLERHEIQKDGR
jgi:hypothetical protein